MKIGVSWDVTVWFGRCTRLHCVTSQKTEVLKIQDIFFHIILWQGLAANFLYLMRRFRQNMVL